MPKHPNVDGVALDGSLGAPLVRASRREHLRLAIAALAFVAVVGAAVKFGTVLASATSDFSFDMPFQGWQLWTAEAALGIGALTVTVLAGMWLRRTYRTLGQRTPHRRAIVLAALLPGWFLGGVLASPSTSVLSWASEHTAAAKAVLHRFEADRRAWLRSPTTRMPGPPAPEVLAAPLLRPADLGQGWYDTARPNPALRSVPSSIAVRGGINGARSWLTQAHRSGGGWMLGLMVAEQEIRFRAPTQAADYARTMAGGSHDCACDDPPAGVARSRIHGLRVWHTALTARDRHEIWGTFAVGDRFFTVLVLSGEGHNSPPATLMQPLRVAVERALRAA